MSTSNLYSFRAGTFVDMLALRDETHEEECDCSLHKCEKCTEMHDPCTRDDTQVIEAWPLQTE